MKNNRIEIEIIDSAHEIQVGNKIPVTLSIGIGKGENIRQSDALQGLHDMALAGRRQAVVKDAESFRFFGGIRKL